MTPIWVVRRQRVKLTWQESERTVIEAALRTALIENLDLLTATILGLSEDLVSYRME